MALNYYHILEVGYNASQEDVKLAYRRLAKKFHPDVNANDAEKEEMFKLVNEAYKVLSDVDKKAAYDLRLLLGIYEEYSATADGYAYDRRTRTFRQRYYQRKYEPVTYSRKTYIAVTGFVLFVAAFIWVVPLTLSWYSSSYHYREGVSFYEKGQYFAALNSLDRAIIDFGSKNAEACLLAATILMNQFGQYSFAIEYANRGLKKAETSAQKVSLLSIKAACLKASANYHSAINTFEEAKLLAAQPDSLYYEVGNIQAFYLYNYKAAIAEYAKLLQSNPAFTEAYYGRAYSYFMLGEQEKAMQDIDLYLSMKDNNGDAFLLKGEIALKAGDSETACSYFKKASVMPLSDAGKIKTGLCP